MREVMAQQRLPTTTCALASFYCCARSPHSRAPYRAWLFNNSGWFPGLLLWYHRFVPSLLVCKNRSALALLAHQHRLVLGLLAFQGQLAPGLLAHQHRMVTGLGSLPNSVGTGLLAYLQRLVADALAHEQLLVPGFFA